MSAQALILNEIMPYIMQRFEPYEPYFDFKYYHLTAEKDNYTPLINYYNHDLFQYLPRELHLLILSYLRGKEILYLSRVNRYWYQLIYDGQLWSSIDLFNQLQGISLKNLTHLIECSNRFIKKIDFRAYPFNNEVLIQTLLNNCPNLKQIQISGGPCLMERKYFRQLLNNSKLKVLKLNGVYDTFLNEIETTCYSLTHLEIRYCRVLPNSSLNNIVSGNQGLEHLDLSGNDKINDLSLMINLSKLKHLKYLNLYECRTIQDAHLNALFNNADFQLSYFNIYNLNQITDLSILQLIKSQKELIYLELGHCILISNNTLNSLFLHFTGLKYLSLEGCSQLNDQNLQTISKSLKQLKKLILSGCTSIHDDSVIEVLKRCPFLAHIELDNCGQLNEALIEYLMSCSRLSPLKSINLIDCHQFSLNKIWDLYQFRKDLKIMSYYIWDWNRNTSVLDLNSYGCNIL